MKNKFFIILLSVLMTACCKDPVNQIPTFEYQIFNTTNSGLPSSFITHVVSDNSNNIWIGTFSSGLVKYDGASWTCYNTGNSKLPNDSITSLYIDRKNRVLVGTNRGLAILDQGKWTTYNKTNSGLQAENILSICSDNNDNIWLGAVTFSSDFEALAGLYFFDGNKWSLYNRKNSILPYEAIHSIVCDKDNVIWLGTAQNLGKGGLVRIKNGQWTLYSNDNSPMKYNVIDRIVLSNNGQLLLSSDVPFEWKSGVLDGYLYLFNGLNSWFDISPSTNNVNLTNRVTATTFDKNGNIWVATSIDPNKPTADYSLSIYSRSNWTILSSILPNFPRTYIPDITVDSSNNIWVAAPDAGGLIKLIEK
jgi:ligand-binding sensor domain-containing protein